LISTFGLIVAVLQSTFGLIVAVLCSTATMRPNVLINTNPSTVLQKCCMRVWEVSFQVVVVTEIHAQTHTLTL
jgi:hypothetical protein